MNVEFQVFFSVAIEMHRMGDVEIISKPCKAIDPGNVHGFGKRSRQEPSTPMSPSISVWRVCIWLFIIRIHLYRFRLKQLLQPRSQDVNTDQSFATERCSDFAVPISACFWDKTWISLFPDMKDKHGVWCVWCLSESIYFLPFLESFPCWDSINKEFRIQQSLFHLWTLGNLQCHPCHPWRRCGGLYGGRGLQFGSRGGRRSKSCAGAGSLVTKQKLLRRLWMRLVWLFGSWQFLVSADFLSQ